MAEVHSRAKLLTSSCLRYKRGRERSWGLTVPSEDQLQWPEDSAGGGGAVETTGGEATFYYLPETPAAGDQDVSI